jgi:ADP-ribose pyrophosphatase YjhB (NUDIX family)
MTGAFDSPPRRGASIAVFKGDAVLLVERSRAPWGGLWSLPGGSLEAGESPREAASRELMEETGFTAKIEGLLNTIEISAKRDDGEAVKCLLDVFYGRYAGGSLQPASDAASARWVALGDLEKLSLTEGTGALVSLAAHLIGAARA